MLVQSKMILISIYLIMINCKFKRKIKALNKIRETFNKKHKVVNN